MKEKKMGNIKQDKKQENKKWQDTQNGEQRNAK